MAEAAVIEYQGGIFKQELETINGEIALAEAELKQAEDRLAWSDRMREKGFVPPRRNVSDRLNLQQKTFALEQARTRKTVLVKYTRDKTVKELQSEVEKVRSVETAGEAAYEREQEAEAWLKKQVEGCKVVAPVGGRVRYFRAIEEGATVRERQLLFRVVPDVEPEAATDGRGDLVSLGSGR